MAPLPQRQQLKPDERGEIIGMRRCGVTFPTIAMNLDLKCDTVRKVWNYYEETGRVVPPPRTGRPPILSEYDCRQLKRHVKSSREHRHEPLADITSALNFNVSEDTLINELKKLNLNHRVAQKKPWLHPAQKLARLEFEKKYGE